MTISGADWPARTRRVTSRAARAARRIAAPSPPTTLPRYDVAALVLAEPDVARGLGEHWAQTVLEGPDAGAARERLGAAELLLVQLPDPVTPSWAGAGLLAAARELDVPVVLWDTAEEPSGRRADHVAVLEVAAGVDHLATVAGDRVEAYASALDGSAVWELPLGVAPWQHLPGGRTGRAASTAVLPPRSGAATPEAALQAAARGTALVSAPLPALERDLAGAVWVETTEEGRLAAARALRRQPELRDRQTHLARRAVLSRHTWADRAHTLVDRAGGPARQPDRSVSAVVPTRRPAQLDHVVDTLAAQVDVPVQLVVVTHGFRAAVEEVRARAADRGLADVTVLEAPGDLTLGACLNLGVEAAAGRYTAKMDDDNLYGPHYLADLVREFETTDAQVVGKWAHYVHLLGTDAVVLRFAGQEHREVDLVQGGTIVMPTADLRATGFDDLPRRVDTTLLLRVRAEGGRIWSADRYNFVSRRGEPGAHTWGITDQQLLTRASTVVFYGDPSRHVTL